MPYIKQEDRVRLKEFIGAANKSMYANTVLLCDFIYTLTLMYYNTTKKKYADINNIVGVLACIRQEYIRRFSIGVDSAYKYGSFPVNPCATPLTHSFNIKHITCAGDFNYLISELLYSVTLKRPSLKEELVQGLLKLESYFYKTQAGWYEDEKIKENGDLLALTRGN